MRGTAPALALALIGAAGPARAEGMPQLNFANPLTTSQVVWMVLIFAALYYALTRYALPQVGGVLQERAAKISADVEAARQAKTQADHAVRELTDSTARARGEAQHAIKAAADGAKATAAAEAVVANARLDEQLRTAEQRIAAARGDAMAALRGVATDTATTLVARLTGRPADSHAVGAAVEDVMAERGHA